MHSPVEQFTIKALYSLNLLGYDISFTNSSLFMVLAILVSAGFLLGAMRPASIIPGKIQCLAEMLYEFVANIIDETVGKEGKPYFPFIFTID